LSTVIVASGDAVTIPFGAVMPSSGVVEDSFRIEVLRKTR